MLAFEIVLIYRRFFSRVRHWGLCLKCEIFVFLVRAASAAVTCVYQCSHRSQLPAIRIISNQNERIDQLCVNNAVVHLYAFASIIRTSGIINIWRQANLIQIQILFLFVRLSFYRSFVFLKRWSSIGCTNPTMWNSKTNENKSECLNW